MLCVYSNDVIRTEFYTQKELTLALSSVDNSCQGSGLIARD